MHPENQTQRKSCLKNSSIKVKSYAVMLTWGLRFFYKYRYVAYAIFVILDLH